MTFLDTPQYNQPFARSFEKDFIHTAENWEQCIKRGSSPKLLEKFQNSNPESPIKKISLLGFHNKSVALQIEFDGQNNDAIHKLEKLYNISLSCIDIMRGYYQTSNDPSEVKNLFSMICQLNTISPAFITQIFEILKSAHTPTDPERPYSS
jgi:hypothetical protein